MPTGEERPLLQSRYVLYTYFFPLRATLPFLQLNRVLSLDFFLGYRGFLSFRSGCLDLSDKRTRPEINVDDSVIFSR